MLLSGSHSAPGSTSNFMLRQSYEKVYVGVLESAYLSVQAKTLLRHGASS
jgi:hypothetical protein